MSGPLPAVLAPLAWPASLVYGTAVRLRNARLDRVDGWRAPMPVLSVGNITAGGTGKSPMVRWVVETLRGMGRSPAIATRGHRGGMMSDEVLEHRDAMPGLPIAVGADRVAAIKALLQVVQTIDALVLDDGFQHRAVARDLDLVLVDATRPGLDGALLPMGWLREPASNLRRASAVVVTRATRVDETLARRIESLHGRAPIAWTSHAWTGVRVQSGGLERAEPVAWLHGRRLAVWAGVGNPQALHAQVRQSGAEVVHAPALRDHHAYGRAGVQSLLKQASKAGAEAVLCTAKDWVKVRDLLPASHPPVVRPELALTCLQGGEALRDAVRAALDAGDSRLRR